tara:strand:+ start:1369 stop:1680 length:312 start_codon:yes stop_codon:yes gene_type:complete
VEFLGDDIVSASIHEILTVVRDPIDELMSRLIELGFSPTAQGSALLYAFSLFVVRYVHHMDEGLEQQTSIKMAQAEVISHPAISRFLARTTGETIDRRVRNEG